MNVGAPSWLVDFLAATSLWDLILWAAGITAAVVFVYKRGWRWVIRFARAILATADVIDSLRDLPGFIDRTDQRLEHHSTRIDGIWHETHKNDGSSIKDAVGRVEQGVAGLYRKVDELTATDDELRRDIESTQPRRGPTT